MTYEKLQKILVNSNIKVAVIGVVILFIGGSIFLTPFLNGKGNVIVAFIIGGIITALGVLALKNTLPNILQARSEKHPLLAAIKENKRDFLVWVYVKEIQVTTQGGDKTLGKSRNLIYFDKDCEGKGVELVVSKSENAHDLYDYLCENFDIPYRGYSSENRDAINTHFGNTGLKKVQ
ncbi:MAG: hypothetical protein MK078_17305 [Crocinitomicaceae bacterium]|nr:hypothetical protein [Crocinitomicaceae bacterium]